jgi:ATP-dependent protease ClpP protease subunit
VKKTVYVRVSGFIEVEVDVNGEDRDEVLSKVEELVHEDSINNINVIIDSSGGQIKGKLEEWNTEIGNIVFDEDGIVVD